MPSLRHQNASIAHDVNGDETVTNMDALTIINNINASGFRSLTAKTFPTCTYLDVTGDGYLTARDALSVINYLNAR